VKVIALVVGLFFLLAFAIVLTLLQEE